MAATSINFEFVLETFPPRVPSEEVSVLAAERSFSFYQDPTAWTGEPLTVRECRMVGLMNDLMEKPEWDRKVFVDDIAAKWQAEATGSFNFFQKEWDYCLAELRDKARPFQATGITVALDYDCKVVYSDSALSKAFAEELSSGVASLENVPAREKDWHPGSGDQVLDLVHPSLFPLIYGRSRVLKDGKVGLTDCTAYIGKGEPLGLREDHQSHDEHGSSRRFQWLPCDVHVSDEDSVRITSYINNLHPAHNKPLYAAIERVISASIPLWNVVLESVQHRSSPRIPVPRDTDDLYERESNGEYVRTGRRRDDEGDDDDEDRPEDRILKWPQPEAYEQREQQASDLQVNLRKYCSDRGMQVIVKLANIHLTPEKPEYSGGSWHVEGMANERIVASSLYYYDTDNVSESSLQFRQQMNTDTYDWEYQQDDYHGFLELMGVESNNDSAISNLGAVKTKQGRLLAFPNVLQHRVPPFHLDDKTKPGHRKILALFLVDPSVEIVSTGTVPPQQKSWWEQELLAAQNHEDRFSDMPIELKQEVFNHVADFPISLEDAKKVREELMLERSVKQKEIDWDHEANTFNFCEH